MACRRGSSGRVPDVGPIFSESYRFVPADVRRNRAAEEHENRHQTRGFGRRQLGRAREHGKRRQRDDLPDAFYTGYVVFLRSDRSDPERETDENQQFVDNRHEHEQGRARIGIAGGDGGHAGGVHILGKRRFERDGPSCNPVGFHCTRSRPDPVRAQPVGYQLRPDCQGTNACKTKRNRTSCRLRTCRL